MNRQAPDLAPLVEEALAIYRRRPTENKLIWVEGMIDAAVLYSGVPAEQGDAWEQQLADGPGFHRYWTWREVHRRRREDDVWGGKAPTLVEKANPEEDLRDAVAHLEEAPDQTRMALAQSLLAAGVTEKAIAPGVADRWETELKSHVRLFDPRLAWRIQSQLRPAVNVPKAKR